MTRLTGRLGDLNVIIPQEKAKLKELSKEEGTGVVLPESGVEITKRRSGVTPSQIAEQRKKVDKLEAERLELKSRFPLSTRKKK